MHGYAILDVPRSGAENMALDEQMLDLATHREAAVLRLYQWSQPTLSLGYFQSGLDRTLSAASQSLDVVRRSTGGGAIVHHHDWTYSLAVPNILLDTRLGASQTLYDCVHQAVVQWLRGWGAQAELFSGCGTTEQGNQPFLCFERRSCGDVVLGGWKVMGSAQRRTRSALLQHGSLLLQRSEFAPSLPGIADLVPGLAGSSPRVAVSKIQEDQQVCHIQGLSFDDFLTQLSTNAKGFLEIADFQMESVESLDLRPDNLGKFADPKWRHRH